MPSPEKTIQVYQELADYYDRQRQAAIRDRFLVQAADAAQSAGRGDEAERLRARLLQLNPHHLLKPFGSFAEASQSPDVRNYIAGLRRTYPFEAAASLLESLRDDEKNHLADLPAEADQAAKDSTENVADALKVYRLQDVPEERPPAAVVPRPSPLRPALKGSPSRSATTRSGLVPTSFPVRPQRPTGPFTSPHQMPPVSLFPSETSDGAELGSSAGEWVCIALFLLVLAAGVALAVYTFVKPFWLS